MNITRAVIIFSVIISIGFSGFFFSSCNEKPLEGMIVFTRSEGNLQNIRSAIADSDRFDGRTSLAIFNPAKPEAAEKSLTGAFYSARSPEISFDGTRLLFTAKEKQNSLWQIWEMDLKDSRTRQVTTLPENCIDPAYLPNGRVIFSKMSTSGDQTAMHAIFSCNADGSDIKQATFNPYGHAASSVLKDGRVLAISWELSSKRKETVFMIMRPDGTKAELFYKSPAGSSLTSRGHETSAGRIVFTESDGKNSEREDVISISYNRPLHSCINLTKGIEGNFISVFSLSSGKLLVTYRKSLSSRYGLYEFDPESKTIGKAVYENKDFDITEAVVVEKHESPKKLASGVG